MLRLRNSLSAKGAMPYQPGATPQEYIDERDQGLKARSMPVLSGHRRLGGRRNKNLYGLKILHALAKNRDLLQ